METNVEITPIAGLPDPRSLTAKTPHKDAEQGTVAPASDDVETVPSVEDTDETRSTRTESEDRAPEAPASDSSVSARLTYDLEESEVFIEILDPRSGDVIQRLPPDKAAGEIAELTGGASGAIFDQVA